MEFCGISTGVNELMVDGFLAHVGIGIVPLFCSSSLANEVSVPIARGTDSVSLLVSHNNEFVEKDFGANQMSAAVCKRPALGPPGQRLSRLSMKEELGITSG